MIRRWCANCSAACWRRSRISRSRSRATAWRRSTQLDEFRAGRHHARRPHAADERPGMPRPHHGAAAVSGRHGVVGDGGRRGRDLERAAPGRRGFCRQAHRRRVAAHGQFAPTFLEKIRAAASAKLPASRRLRERVQFEAGAACARRERERAAEIAEALPDAARRGHRSGRNVHRRAAGAGSVAGSAAGDLSLADSRRAAHARRLHRSAWRKRLDGICALEVRGGCAAHADATGLRLYRSRRRRYHRIDGPAGWS